MTAKAYSKDDLKRLMQLKKASAAASRRIDSPLARYDPDGNLSCKVCDTPIKSSSLWPSHLTSAQHRQSIELLKKKRQAEARTNPAVSSPSQQQKSATNALSSGSNVGNLSKRVRAHGPDSNVDEDVCRPTAAKRDAPSVTATSSGNDTSLPPDFFDPSIATGAPPPPASADAASNRQQPRKEERAPSSDEEAETSANRNIFRQGQQHQPASTADLPKGFFDDEKADAKARQVAFKPAIEEEWAEFQRVMAAETTRSETMVEEELEDIQVERDVEEIEEQLSSWARIDTLQKSYEQRKQRTTAAEPEQRRQKSESRVTAAENRTEDEPNSSSDEEEALEAFNDWRRKGSGLRKRP